MNKERLMRLHDLLLADAAKPDGISFNMRYWGLPTGYTSTDYAEGKQISEKWVPEASCGTQGCAMGLAAMSGIFLADGLSYQMSGAGVEPRFVKPGDNPANYYEGYSAAAKLFELPRGHAHWLFCGESYETTEGANAEREAAARIKAYVDNDGVGVPVRHQWG